MTCHLVHIDPSFCPNCRYEPWVAAQQIRDGLRSVRSGGYERIRFDAYSLDEVDAIKSFLTTDELALVSFTWMFGK
jgi:hypothetical protein